MFRGENEFLVHDFVCFACFLSIGKDSARLAADGRERANTTAEDFVIAFGSEDFKRDRLIELSDFIGDETKAKAYFAFRRNHPSETDNSRQKFLQT